MISAQVRAQVRQRAQNACEYCHLHQDDSPLAALHVEHIIPKIHGGSDDVENLPLPVSIATFTKEQISPDLIPRQM